MAFNLPQPFRGASLSQELRQFVRGAFHPTRKEVVQQLQLERERDKSLGGRIGARIDNKTQALIRSKAILENAKQRGDISVIKRVRIEIERLQGRRQRLRRAIRKNEQRKVIQTESVR